MSDMAITHVFFDFDGVFTDNKVYVFDNGQEAVCCHRADGIGIQKLKDRGIEVWIISTETNEVVAKRADKLGIPFMMASEDKLGDIEMLCSDLSKAVFVGNDENDLEALCAVGYPIITKDATYKVMDTGREKDFFILNREGGQGAVREACESILMGFENEVNPIYFLTLGRGGNA